MYSLDVVPATAQKVLKLNPLTAFTYSMRQVFYNLSLPTTTNWLMMGSSATVSLLLGWWVFSRDTCHG